MDALHDDDDDDDDDDADELTLVSDSEDNDVQHERPQVGMKTIPESYYDDAGLVTDIENVTLDSFDLEEELADIQEPINAEDLENTFIGAEEYLEGAVEEPVTLAVESSNCTANEPNVDKEIVLTEDSDSFDGLFTDDEENDLDALNVEDEIAGLSPSNAVIETQVESPSKPGPSSAGNVIKASAKRKRSDDESDYEEILEQGKASGIQSRRLSKRQRVDDERTRDVSEQKKPRAITSSSEPATVVKATGKSKRSDDENLKTADGNSEQKNNRSATTSTRPAKRKRSDENNLDTIPIDQNTIHQNSMLKDTIHKDKDTIPEGGILCTTISDSDLKFSPPIQLSTTEGSCEKDNLEAIVQNNLHDIDQDNLDDISEKKKVTNTSPTTKKAPRTKTAPKKVPTRSSSRASTKGSAESTNKTSTKTTADSSSKPDSIPSNPDNRRITRSMSSDPTPAITEPVLKTATMDNAQSSSMRSSPIAPPVKKALTLKEQRALYAAKAKAAGKGDVEPPFRTVQVPITSTTSKPAKRSTRPTSKAPKTRPAEYAPKAAMKKNVRPSSKFAAKASTEPSSKDGSTLASPIVKRALTLKEQRALYTASQKTVAQVTRQASSKTTMKENVQPSSRVAEKPVPPEPSSKEGSPIASPIIKKALTLKEQMAPYAARGKVTANLLRQARASSSSNVAAKSPTEQAVQRYYSTSAGKKRSRDEDSDDPKDDVSGRQTEFSSRGNKRAC
ncbi:hypothetical protein N0V85_006441 [Neurospora sp. IMI 360204]|nr:hypothetical protein N0V85_006441 [Neurospora sp. IMI 360204]